MVVDHFSDRGGVYPIVALVDLLSTEPPDLEDVRGRPAAAATNRAPHWHHERLIVSRLWTREDRAGRYLWLGAGLQPPSIDHLVPAFGVGRVERLDNVVAVVLRSCPMDRHSSTGS